MGGVYLAYLKLPVFFLLSFLIGLLLIKHNLRSLLITLFILLAFFRAYPLFPAEFNFKEGKTTFTIRLAEVEIVKGESLFPGYVSSGGVKGTGRVISGPSFYRAPYLRFFIPKKAYVVEREPEEGEVYRTSGELRPLRPCFNPYGFSEEEFYPRRGVRGIFRIEKLEKVASSGSSGLWGKWQSFGIPTTIKAYLYSLYKNLPSPAREILPAVALGIKPEGDIQEVFSTTGTYHLLVVSGLHFALLFSFLKQAGLSKPLMILLLSFFLLLVGPAPSSLRAFIMVGLPLLFFPGFLKNRSHYSLPLLFSSGSLVLLILPYSIFDTGFYLSFGATAGIILISPRLKDARPFKILPTFLRENLSITLGANLAILPVLLYNFLELPAYFIPANLFGTTLLSFLLPLGLSYPTLYLIPGLGFLLKSILTGLSFLLYEGLELIAELPYACLFIPFPVLVATILSFAVFLILSFLILRWLGRAKIQEGDLSRVGLLQIQRVSLSWLLPVGGALLTFLIVVKLLTPSGFELVFLYAGQGNGAMLRTPAGRVYLLDAGSRKEDGKNYLRLLSRWGKTSIEGLIITHPHGDHYLGAEELINKGYVKSIYSSDSSFSEPGFRRFLEEPAGRRLSMGRRLSIHKVYKMVQIKDGDVILRLTSPAEVDPRDPNTFSLLIEVSYKGYDFLLPGDAPIPHLQNFSKDIEVLKVPHHGARIQDSEDAVACHC